MSEAALYVVIVFALVVVIACGFGIAQPARLIGFVESVIESRRGMWIAVWVRLIAGGAFLGAASASRYPLLFQIVGALSLAAAVSIPIVGHKRFIAMVAWFSTAPLGVIRVWGVIGIAFGALILYASW